MALLINLFFGFQSFEAYLCLNKTNFIPYEWNFKFFDWKKVRNGAFGFLPHDFLITTLYHQLFFRDKFWYI